MYTHIYVATRYKGGDVMLSRPRRKGQGLHIWSTGRVCIYILMSSSTSRKRTNQGVELYRLTSALNCMPMRPHYHISKAKFRYVDAMRILLKPCASHSSTHVHAFVLWLSRSAIKWASHAERAHEVKCIAAVDPLLRFSTRPTDA